MPQDPEIYEFAREFTDCPGGRSKDEGPDSGELFYETVLRPRFEKGIKTLLVLNGAYGFATAFLDGAFGEFAAQHGIAAFHEHFTIQSEDDPSLIEEIEYCMERAVAQDGGGRGTRGSERT